MANREFCLGTLGALGVYLDDGAEYTLSKIRDHTNLQRGTAISDGCAAIPRDLSRLEPQEVQSKEMQSAVPGGSNPRNLYALR